MSADLDLDAILQRADAADAEDSYTVQSALDVRVLVEEIRALRSERDDLIECGIAFRGRIPHENLPYNASVMFHEIVRTTTRRDQ